MSAYRWECEICEEGRAAPQVVSCLDCCDDTGIPAFYGYCCKQRHTAETGHRRYAGAEEDSRRREEARAAERTPR